MEPPNERTPQGFTILGVLSLIFGTILFLLAILVGNTPNPPATSLPFLVLFLLAGLHISLGFGLLSMKGWAWFLSVVVSIVYVLVGVIGALNGMFPLFLIISGVIFYYFTSKRIRSAFALHLRSPGLTNRVTLALLLIAVSVAFSVYSVPAGGSALLPWGDIVNAVSGVLLGPWYAFLIAISSGLVRTSFGNSSYFVFSVGIPGALAVGFARSRLSEGRRLWASLFEPVGALFGALFSLLIGVQLSAFNFLLPSLESSILGGLMGFLILSSVYPSQLHLKRFSVVRPRSGRNIVPVIIICMIATPGYASAYLEPSAPTNMYFWANGINLGTLSSHIDVNAAGYTSQNGSIIYGDNQPIIYVEVKANLGSAYRCWGCPFILKLVRMTETFANATGRTVGLNVFNLNSIGTTGSGYLYSPEQGVHFEWSNPWGINSLAASDFSTRSDLYFETPGVYLITVTTHAEIWVNYGNILALLTTAQNTTSFQYVYENDANKGGDAPNSPAGAYGVAPGNYSGFMYGIDTQDWYSFSAQKGQSISVNLTSPPNANFDLKLLNSSLSYVAGSSSQGTTRSITYQASSTGLYYIQIYTVSGYGTCNFSIGLKG